MQFFLQSKRVYKKRPSAYETLLHNTSNIAPNTSTLKFFYKQIFFFTPERDTLSHVTNMTVNMLERDGCKEKVQTTDKESSGMDKGGGKKKRIRRGVVPTPRCRVGGDIRRGSRYCH